MNILITGGKGFLANELVKYFSNSKYKYNLIVTDQRTLNPTLDWQVREIFEQMDIDFVIHTAVKGGKRIDGENVNHLFDNIAMFNNLSAQSNKFKLMFNFGSGAEFDRRTNISSAKEDDESCPADYYGLSKKVIKREIDKIENFYNLRIFGCFGVDEADTRFIKSAVRNVKEGKPIEIHQNRYMDFIYIEDLCKVVEHYVENISKKTLAKDMNLCYNKNKSLLDIANKINKLMGNDFENVIIKQSGYHTEYTGDGQKMHSLDLELCGLDKGLERWINV